ncbi:MAG TPA: hypothetical protein VK007_08035 [Acidimicrobiales bacterium]|nr:hypothetical protein [Acidimicrobiales bacterium]
MATAAGRWTVTTYREPPSAFHARAIPDAVVPSVWVCDPTVPALVLGSAQPEGVADHAACTRAGVEVVRRRSGGGAVLVVPGDLLWVDVLVPAGDPRWEVDVGRAFHWLGEAWASALRQLGIGAVHHEGALVSTPWSRLVCFAGLGPGEVVRGPNIPGPKVVGISQRRTRAGARFQCAALRRWDPEALARLLRLDEPARARLVADVAPSAAPVDVAADDLLGALLHELAAR